MKEQTKIYIVYIILSLLCIVCIILVSVLSTGNKGWDWFLGVLSVSIFIGMSSIIYTWKKNEKDFRKMIKEMENNLVLLKLSEEIRDDVKKNNKNSKENLNNNEQKIIQIQNVQEQRDLVINKYREDTQQKILQIIEDNKNNKDKISSLIITEIFNTINYTDFFKNYQSKYLIPIQNKYNKNTIDYISRILLLYNQLTDIDKYIYRSAKDDNTRKNILNKVINNSNNQKIPEHIESVVTTKAKLYDKTKAKLYDKTNIDYKLSDEVTLNFIEDVQKNKENNDELNNKIIEYIKYLKTQNINVMPLFNKNVKDKIHNEYLFNNIWKKAWLVSIGRHPDSDLNSLGTGDR